MMTPQGDIGTRAQRQNFTTVRTLSTDYREDSAKLSAVEFLER
jgi:hypothetical protein